MKFSIQEFDHLSSTQDQLKSISANEEFVEGLVVQAASQGSGRGRMGREWLSPKGNLYLSVLLEPSVPLSRFGEVGFVISLALAKTLEQLKIYDVLLKWPNDVLIKAQKCAGILLEQEDEKLYVGIGLNVAHAPLKEATSLKDVGVNEPLENVRDLFLDTLAGVYDRWQEDGFEHIRQDWLNHAHEKGTKLHVQLKSQSIDGTFEGLDEAGHLLLRDKTHKTHRVSSADVMLREG